MHSEHLPHIAPAADAGIYRLLAPHAAEDLHVDDSFDTAAAVAAIFWGWSEVCFSSMQGVHKLRLSSSLRGSGC